MRARWETQNRLNGGKINKNKLLKIQQKHTSGFSFVY